VSPEFRPRRLQRAVDRRGQIDAPESTAVAVKVVPYAIALPRDVIAIDVWQFRVQDFPTLIERRSKKMTPPDSPGTAS